MSRPHAPSFFARRLWARRPFSPCSESWLLRQRWRHPRQRHDGVPQIDFLTLIADGQPQMFVGSPDKVYILDKVEGNAYQINGHSAYASVW